VSLKGVATFYNKEAEPKKDTDKTDNQHLVLDGTVNLDYSDDVPRIKGLIELIKEYFGERKKTPRLEKH
jgi:hypothetical protein